MTGCTPPGLAALAAALEPLGEVYVIAPDREQSAVGHALTLHRPLRVETLGERRFAVNGTPSDCVNLGVLGLLPEPPVLVVSGINHGANLGDDVTYSGTVSAAMEGTLLGVPLDRGLAGRARCGGGLRGGGRGGAGGGHAAPGGGPAGADAPQRERAAGAAAGHPHDAAGTARVQREGDPRGGSARTAVLLDRGGPAGVGGGRGHGHRSGAQRAGRR